MSMARPTGHRTLAVLVACLVHAYLATVPVRQAHAEMRRTTLRVALRTVAPPPRSQSHVKPVVQPQPVARPKPQPKLSRPQPSRQVSQPRPQPQLVHAATRQRVRKPIDPATEVGTVAASRTVETATPTLATPTAPRTDLPLATTREAGPSMAGVVMADASTPASGALGLVSPSKPTAGGGAAERTAASGGDHGRTKSAAGLGGAAPSMPLPAPPPVASAAPKPEPVPVAPAPVVPKPEPPAAPVATAAMPQPRPKPEPHDALPSRPQPLTRPYPDIPRSARESLHETVAVTVQISVSAAGSVTGVSVTNSSGNAAIDSAASAACRRWRFSAARNGGTFHQTFRIKPL